MCRGHIEFTGMHVEEGVLNAIAYGNREGIIITGISIDKKSFKLLKQHKGLSDTPNSFELYTSYRPIMVHSD
jgi:hypothetical protein